MPQPSDARVCCLPQIAGSAPSSLRARPLRVTSHSLTSASLRRARGLAGGRLRARWGTWSLRSRERLRSASRLERSRFAAQLPAEDGAKARSATPIAPRAVSKSRTRKRSEAASSGYGVRIGTCTYRMAGRMTARRSGCPCSTVNEWLDLISNLNPRRQERAPSPSPRSSIKVCNTWSPGGGMAMATGISLLSDPSSGLSTSRSTTPFTKNRARFSRNELPISFRNTIPSPLPTGIGGCAAIGITGEDVGGHGESGVSAETPVGR